MNAEFEIVGILLLRWDPLDRGPAWFPAVPTDEYDRFASPLYGALIGGAAAAELVDLLAAFEEQLEVVVRSDRAKLDEVARDLLDWFSQYERRPRLRS